MPKRNAKIWLYREWVLWYNDCIKAEKAGEACTFPKARSRGFVFLDDENYSYCVKFRTRRMGCSRQMGRGMMGKTKQSLALYVTRCVKSHTSRMECGCKRVKGH